MGAWRTARDIYLSLRDDPTAVAALRTEAASLAVSIATTDAGSMEITSATVNGQSYAGQRSMTKAQRLSMLQTVLAMVDADANISRTSTPIFGGYGIGK